MAVDVRTADSDSASTQSSMPLRRCFLICLLVFASASAFARVGPDGVLGFGAILKAYLRVSFLVGLISGAFGGVFLRSRPTMLAVVSIVPWLVALMFSQPFAVAAGLPLLILWVTYWIVRGGVFQAHVGHSSAASGHTEPAHAIACLVRWLAITYLFWAAFSLVNLELLAFLVVPPLTSFGVKWIAPHLAFGLPPLAMAVVIGGLATRFFAMKRPSTRHAAPLIFNACVLVAFLASAEIYRHHLMSRALALHKPTDLYISFFLSSVLDYGEFLRAPHASFDEGGKHYNWSYAQRDFVEAP